MIKNSITVHIHNMYVELTPYTHVLISENFGYIANQLSGKQMSFDSDGALWLTFLKDQPAKIEQIIKDLSTNYSNCQYSQLAKDYMEFLENLEKDGFVRLSSFEESLKSSIPSLKLHSEIPTITDITIEITNLCNERCVHCYIPNKMKDHGKSMTVSNVKKLIDEFAEIHGKSITFTGGEVFLHSSFEEILDYAQYKGLQISIYSNLITLNSKHVHKLKELNVAVIQTSLYGISEKIHDSITRVKGSCLRTKQSIECLLEHDIPVRIACPVLCENRKEIVNVVKYAREKSIQIDVDFNITPRLDKSDDNLEHRMNINELEKCITDLMKYDKEYALQLLHRHKNIYDPNFNLVEHLNTPICPAGFHGLYVTPAGSVTTCPNLQGLSVDSISNHSLKDIWYDNSKLQSIRTTLEGSFPKCIRCVARDFCSRCFAMNYTETGSLTNPPKYACEMAFLFKKIFESN